MRLEISDVPSAFNHRARPTSEADLAQGLTHGAIAVAMGCGVDIGFGDRANVVPAAEKAPEMSFLVAPGCDLDSAFGIRIGIEDTGGFERIDDAEGSIEPARIVLAFQM